MASKNHQGSCHCGQVKFEAKVDLAEGTSKCNCTNCWKKRFWGVRVKPENFRYLAGQEQLSKYKQGQEKGHGGFCKQCGVHVFGWVDVSEWNPTEYVSVNVAALDKVDPADLVAAPVTYCDGLNNNWWNPPAETRYL
jgi:hypothetical protein